MSNAAIKVGRQYMVSLGRKGAISGRVVGRMPKSLGGEWIVLTVHGDELLASGRRLSPVPLTDADGRHIGTVVKADLLDGDHAALDAFLVAGGTL